MKNLLFLLAAFAAFTLSVPAQIITTLPSGSAISDTDILPDVQGWTGGTTGITAAVTALQFKTYAQNGTVLTSGSYANPLWITSLAYSKLTGTPSSLPPSGTAGGDLGGTYPNPTVIGLNGTPLSSLTTGLLKNTTGTGAPTIAIAGTDYMTPMEASSLYVPITLTVNGHALSGNITISASDITAGTLPIGQIPTGTSSSTVAIGNDSRIIGALQSSVAATTYQPLNSALTAFSGGNTFTGAGLLTISGTWPNLTLTVPTGTTSATAAAGNDTRFPASVTGLRKSAGAGSTDTAAVPDIDYASPTTVFQSHMGPSNHNFLFMGDSITEGPHGSQTYAQQSFAAVCQYLSLGAGGAFMYDMGLKQYTTANITQSWFGNAGVNNEVLTTAIYTSGASTITVASNTGMSVGNSVMAIGLQDNTLITSITGTSIGISLPTITAQTTTPCCICAAVHNYLYSEPYPGGEAQGWGGFGNSGQQLCQYSGRPTDVYLLAGANDYTVNMSAITPTVSTTNGSYTITVSASSGIGNGMGISSANIPANDIITSGQGTTTLTIAPLPATATASGTACTITAYRTLAVTTTNGSPNVTITGGYYSDLINGEVLLGANFSTATVAPTIQSGGGTTSLVMNTNSTSSGSTTATVYFPTTSLATYESLLTTFVGYVHAAPAGKLTVATLIGEGDNPGQGSPASQAYCAEYNAYIRSNGMGADYVSDLASQFPTAGNISTGNPFYHTDLLHLSILGCAVAGKFINADYFAQQLSLIQGPYAAPGVGNLNSGTPTVYVSVSRGDDQKTAGLKYSFDQPYATMTAAMIAAIAGDTIEILDGAVTNAGVTLKNGVNINFRSGVTMTTGFVMTDGGTPVTCVISGQGNTFTSNDSFSSFLSLTGTGSNVTIQDLNLVGTSGQSGISETGTGDTINMVGNLSTTGSSTNALALSGGSTFNLVGNIAIAGNGDAVAFNNGTSCTLNVTGNVSNTGSGYALYVNGTHTINISGKLSAAMGQAISNQYNAATVNVGSLTEGSTVSSLKSSSTYIALTINSAAPVITALANPSTTTFTQAFSGGVVDQIINLTQTSATMAAGTFTLPPDANSRNGELCEIANNSAYAITSLSITASGGTVYGVPSNLSAGQRLSIRKIAANVWSAK